MCLQPQTFLISDTHFNHENIISLCRRPFADVAGQNATLIRNWNQAVSPNDTVFHLGDFILGAADTVPSILSALNGNITLIQGNHDSKAKLLQYKDRIKVRSTCTLDYLGRRFTLAHDPNSYSIHGDVPEPRNTPNSYYIHGHVHNDMPFHTPNTNTFNVSVEVVNYTPINIKTICRIIEEETQC